MIGRGRCPAACDLTRPSAFVFCGRARFFPPDFTQPLTNIHAHIPIT